MANLLKKNKKDGVRADHVVIRPRTPWYYYIFAILILFLVLAGLVWGVHKVGLIAIRPDFSPQNQNAKVPRSIESDNCLKYGSQELCSQLSGLRRQLRMNSTIHENLSSQVKMLGEENSHLKEELAFFQLLMSGNEKLGSGVSIYRFKLMNGQENNIYRYSLSLAQGGRRPKNFEGMLRFSVNLRHNDQRKTIPLTNKNNSQDFSVQFKFFHRMEENFQIPPDTTLETLQVQVFEKNDKKSKLTQTIKLSP